MMIRKEIHTMTKFASQEYYKRLRKFLKIQKKSGFEIDNPKHFLYLSGEAVKKLHIDLCRCKYIYDYYTLKIGKVERL